MAKRRGGVKIKVISLKRGARNLSTAQLQKILRKACKAKVGFVVLNAPFKLGTAA